jgi:hypothetical protein
VKTAAISGLIGGLNRLVYFCLQALGALPESAFASPADQMLGMHQRIGGNPG